MKKILYLLLIASFPAWGQNANPFPKTITVTGSAEMEVIPDEVYVDILLREYQKKGEAKKDLTGIQEAFLAACKNAGIADSSISISAYNGFNNYYYLIKKSKKDPEMFSTVTYQVKFSSSKQLDILVKGLDDEATQSFTISRVSHSRIIEFRRKLKIEAIKSAKEKASYLLESINEKAGSAITVKEPEEEIADERVVASRTSNAAFEQVVFDKSGIDFRKIKLRFKVTVIFAIQ